jgi:hypothetical protein
MVRARTIDTHRRVGWGRKALAQRDLRARLNATVALSAIDVWAVGQRQELNGGIITLTQRFDGTAWTTVPSPNPGGVGDLIVNSLDAAASAQDGRLTAAGSQEIPGQCCLRTRALMTTRG